MKAGEGDRWSASGCRAGWQTRRPVAAPRCPASRRTTAARTRLEPAVKDVVHAPQHALALAGWDGEVVDKVAVQVGHLGQVRGTEGKGRAGQEGRIRW